MISLVGIISIFIVAIVVGKHLKRIHPMAYIIIVLLALLQMGVVLYDMYTSKNPNNEEAEKIILRDDN